MKLGQKSRQDLQILGQGSKNLRQNFKVWGRQWTLLACAQGKKENSEKKKEQNSAIGEMQ